MIEDQSYGLGEPCNCDNLCFGACKTCTGKEKCLHGHTIIIDNGKPQESSDGWEQRGGDGSWINTRKRISGGELDNKPEMTESERKAWEWAKREGIIRDEDPEETIALKKIIEKTFIVHMRGLQII